MEEMKIISKKITEIIPYINNAKQHPQEQIDQIKASIKEFGFNDPIAVDQDNVIIEGHGRLKAAEQMGFENIPVIVLKHLTEIQKKQYILFHNKSTMNTGFDIDILKLEMEAIKFEEGDLGLTGFEVDELGGLKIDLEGVIEEEEEEEEDFLEEIPEINKKSYTKPGDIWQLGKHRVLCADCTNEENIKILMNGKRADLVHTDPPYGMKKKEIENDNLNFNDLLEFNKKWIPLSLKYSKEMASWYCWGIDQPLMDIYSNILRPLIDNNEITFRNLITWSKGSAQGINSEEVRMYPTSDEKCLFIMKGTQGFNTNSDNYYEGWEPIRSYLEDEKKKLKLTYGEIAEVLGISKRMVSHWMTTSQFEFIGEKYYLKLQKEYGGFKKDYKAFSKEYETIKKQYEKIKKEYYDNRAYFDNTHDNMTNVWTFQRMGEEERQETGHPTPKPILLCSRVIKSSSREGEIVLDQFGGSGSTLIAAEILGRTAYLCELEPNYIDVIIKRYRNLDKTDIKLIRDGKTYKWKDLKNNFE